MDFLFLDVFTIQAAIRLAAPILIAAQGETLVQRSGVINIGVEGMMLAGAFAGMFCAYAAAGHGLAGAAPYLGAAGAAMAGLAMSLPFAWFAVIRKGDQIVVGAAINIFALGLTGLLNRRIFGLTGEGLTVPVFPDLPIPFLADLPAIGPFFRMTALGYLAVALTAASCVFLFGTRHGVALRAIGEQPRAADSVGLNVQAYRVRAVLFGGLAAGVAGGALSLWHANTFVERMTVGKGFIAIAIVIFGRWHPIGVALAALFFGAVEAIGIRLQAAGVDAPYQLFRMTPYIFTLLALALFSARTRGPAAIGIPYERE